MAATTEAALLEEIQIMERENELAYGLPHLYGWKFYPWAREFFESRNKINLLCAANQISKSSTQIRKLIDWATDKEKWPQLWSRRPSQFWYLYPSQEVVNTEFEQKWEPEFLPRGKFKNDPKYGWKRLKNSRNDTLGIRFNTGVTMYFKTYTKNVQHMQTGTVDAIFCDEELPTKLYDELIMRLNATNGYFHMVFTATLGQEFWRQVMEPQASEDELLASAAKWTVSLYDSMFYEDGSPSLWDDVRIGAILAKCKNHGEILKRVYGRFVKTEGRLYPTFDAGKHLKKGHPIPPEWNIYSGVDIGSGGETGHPAAIVFVAVRPDFRAGRVILGWRGDGQVTTDSDIVLKYIELKKRLDRRVTAQYYDWASKDFQIISMRMSEVFTKAEKGHEKGEGILNTLFKNDMLLIYEDAEMGKLVGELCSLRENEPKNKAKDDFTDALRYAVSSVPWDFSGLVGVTSSLIDTPEKPMNRRERELSERRRAFEDHKQENELQREFDEINELCGS